GVLVLGIGNTQALSRQCERFTVLFSASLEGSYLCAKRHRRAVKSQLSINLIANQVSTRGGSCGDRYEVDQNRALRLVISTAFTPQPRLNSAQAVWLRLGKHSEDSPFCVDPQYFRVAEQGLSRD